MIIKVKNIKLLTKLNKDRVNSYFKINSLRAMGPSMCITKIN